MSKMCWLFCGLLLLVNPVALAQTPQPAPPGPQQSAAPTETDEKLTEAQLDSLVSPIALYPDTLLSQVLIASTYPLEVIEADRWLKGNKSLKGDALKSAVEKQKWDESVKSLTATPSVLEMMSSQLSWMQQLGDAVLAQQPDVMDAVQRLRAKAEANGKLASNKQQTVSSQTQGSKKVIVIQPTQPDTVYVPYYNPSVVYGSWPNPAYPPYYWPAPGYIATGVLATGLAFSAGYALGRWASGGNYWGSNINWNNNNININRGNNNWVHNPTHRQGVRYSNTEVGNRFGGNRNAGVSDRTDFRGRGGQQVLRPDGDARPGSRGGERAANRPGGGRGEGAANRPGGGAAANRPTQRPSAGGGPGGNRPAQRPSAGGGRDNALGNVGSGRQARAESARGRASLGGGGARSFSGGGGGGGRSFGGGGGGRGGGGRGGGGRRSDLRLKHDVAYLGQLDNGLGFYRFAYTGSRAVYVGVMAQEVQSLAPQAVLRGSDGYLRVRYDLLGLQLQTYDHWVESGAKLPATGSLKH
jgi:uncharacterized protein DUF3300/endosialidase-like protein